MKLESVLNTQYSVVRAFEAPASNGQHVERKLIQTMASAAKSLVGTLETSTEKAEEKLGEID